MRPFTFLTCLPLLSLTLDCCQARAPPPREFSADIVQRDAAGRAFGPTGRLFVAANRVRIEAGDATGGFYLVGGNLGSALFVQSTGAFYVAAKRSSVLTQIFVPIDTNQPCSQWQAAAIDAGAAFMGEAWQCDRSEEFGAAHPGVAQYRVKAGDQPGTLRWVDPTLGVAMGFRTADGTTFMLEHLRAGPQARGLFEVPGSFRRLDPQGLIDRIKQSDVWVE